MKMYGAVTDAGTVELAQLIAAMTGKMDTSRYEADKGLRIRGRVRVGSNGVMSVPADLTVLGGCIGVTYHSAGSYELFFDSQAWWSLCFLGIQTQNRFGVLQNGSINNSVIVRTYNNAGVLSDSAFTLYHLH